MCLLSKKSVRARVLIEDDDGDEGDSSRVKKENYGRHWLQGNGGKTNNIFSTPKFKAVPTSPWYHDNYAAYSPSLCSKGSRPFCWKMGENAGVNLPA